MPDTDSQRLQLTIILLHLASYNKRDLHDTVETLLRTSITSPSIRDFNSDTAQILPRHAASSRLR
ncbi:hypothetical protein, partial [Pseudomonas viridiflava]|uniref:hypothetical protein n=1 Tax=Pseudomonas viridiflava TaxID=33069 RepID=UPI00197DF64B